MHCENNENYINTQTIANGLSLSLHLHLASRNRFLLQQLSSFIVGDSDKEFQQIWRSLENLKSNCSPPAPPCTDRRQGMFHFTPLMLSAVSFFTSAAVSPLLVENNHDTSFLLCFHWSCCGDEWCCLAAYSLFFSFFFGLLKLSMKLWKRNYL